jgi:phage FluMu protein Com
VETLLENVDATVEEEAEIEAEYALEREVKCPTCKASTQTFNVVRALRCKVNFTSNLPRRGFTISCPHCNSILSANIGARFI